MGSANVEVVSRCLSPRTIGLERLAQGRTYELISVLYTRLSSTRVYIYVTCPNSYTVRRIMIALMSLPWKTPGLDSATYCVVANLCTTVRLQPNAESPRARAQTQLLDGPFSRLLRHAGSYTIRIKKPLPLPSIRIRLLVEEGNGKPPLLICTS